jgi:hypothetical protein
MLYASLKAAHKLGRLERLISTLFKLNFAGEPSDTGELSVTGRDVGGYSATFTGYVPDDIIAELQSAC